MIEIIYMMQLCPLLNILHLSAKCCEKTLKVKFDLKIGMQSYFEILIEGLLREIINLIYCVD